MSESEQYEASVELEYDAATRRVVDSFGDVTLRVTGTEIGSADGIDVHVKDLDPRDDAVVELIADGEVLGRVIQRYSKNGENSGVEP